MKNGLVIRKKKMYEEVVERITRLIKTGEYKVGDRLPPVQELSEMFGVGTPTLREGLSVLASSGILEIRHGNGIYVKRFPLEPEDLMAQLNEVEYQQLLSWVEFRRALEAEAAALAAERSDEADLEAMEAAEKRLEEEITRGEITIEPDYQFHNSIALATKNPIFIQTATTIEHIIRQYFQLSLRYGRTLPWHRDLVVIEHRKILENISKRRPREARNAMLEHLNNVAGRVKLLESLARGEQIEDR
ncbi:FadR/GntR family transcriptional regulator [Neomoorella mulderi]|uniref:HTH-type transcriptional regulator LutR n=1 Tax=Moorella mulderi DSM 14980 TaxID=1122241 RepID=A0A151AW38_9FIRM|nr:FadR/GntR family transcriptional regulator [Moorella mulderi]KYH31848.1 HTH-type transcriptional regulator LutR [Moorella mulderi DSM 14980]